MIFMYLVLFSDCDLQDLRDSSEEIKGLEQEEASKHLPVKSVTAEICNKCKNSILK